MCGPGYDYEAPPRDSYRVQVKLAQYYNYCRNHKPGETQREYIKRMKELKS
jgi:hypothetical protein